MLPYEIIDEIISYLNYRETKIILNNKDNESFWKIKYMEDYGFNISSIKTYEKKYIFIERYIQLLSKINEYTFNINYVVLPYNAHRVFQYLKCTNILDQYDDIIIFLKENKNCCDCNLIEEEIGCINCKCTLHSYSKERIQLLKSLKIFHGQYWLALFPF